MPPPGAGDHVRGEGDELILYLDLACPYCAALWGRLDPARTLTVFRHFPVSSRHPRAPALHAAVEAAGLQRAGAFWELVESIYRDQGRVDDPHLWARARGLGLDLEAFERDRRAQPVASRVRRDFDGGIRAGVSGTPTVFLDGRPVPADKVYSLPL